MSVEGEPNPVTHEPLIVDTVMSQFVFGGKEYWRFTCQLNR